MQNKMMIENKESLKSNKNLMASAGAAASTRTQSKLSKLDSILSYIPLIGGSLKPTIAVFRLAGVIGRVSSFKSGLTLESTNALIEKMFKIDNLDAICLSINSPGGSPVQAELIASRIISLAKEKEIPVYSFVEDVAASGGYWLACAGERIYASRSSIVGSIGVISSGFGFHEAIEKLGIERRVYTAGKTKSTLDPFKPTKKADVEALQKIQEKIHDHFIDYVKKRRAGKLTQNDDFLFNGAFWSGEMALDYGLIDGIDNLYSFIKKNYGENTKIINIEPKQSWVKKRLSVSRKGEKFAEELTESLLNSIEQRLISNKFEFK
jgi:signal peptide peptidase SppA